MKKRKTPPSGQMEIRRFDGNLNDKRGNPAKATPRKTLQLLGD